MEFTGNDLPHSGACRIGDAGGDDSGGLGMVKKTATIMICSNCGEIIARAEPNTRFDIYDCSWICNHCSTVWYDTDGWEEIGSILVPYRNASIKYRRLRLKSRGLGEVTCCV